MKGPLGGLVWHHLQYVLGFKKMGWEVLFLEYSEQYEACYDPSINLMTQNPSYGLRFIESTFRNHDIQNDWAYYDEHKQVWYGKAKAEVNSFIASADMLLNLSGIGVLNEELLKIKKRVFIDTDPVFTQIKHLQEKSAFENAKKHTHFLTYGENFGHSNCKIPDDGFPWKATRQPIIPEIWPVVKGNEKSDWTTVMQWESYSPKKIGDLEFGMKSKSFETIENVPSYVSESFSLALGSSTAPRDRLIKKGWGIEDPLVITHTSESYQKFIQQSKGEFTVVKQGYAISNSGWFSERSAAYLISGRPVITQSTDFEKNIPTGNGLYSFKTTEEAIDNIRKISSSYLSHCKSAKEIAFEYFNYKSVILRVQQV